jgi:hypothetical protein
MDLLVRRRFRHHKQHREINREKEDVDSDYAEEAKDFYYGEGM